MAEVEDYRYGKLHINYFDVVVPTVIVGKSVYFPIRTLCKIMGIAPQMQIKSIRANKEIPKDAIRTLPVPTIKGIRDTECIHKRGCSKWLSGIDEERCAITAQGSIKRFKEELFAAADRFLFGETGSELVSGPVTYARMKAGACPRCGTHLILEIKPDGPHLIEDSDSE